MEIDYRKIGLKVGLEIHQQLNSTEKLFCACKPQLFKEEPDIKFLRTLRPTQSELGQIDPAAFFEFQKGLRILYEGGHETSCLVEMDEEPPHDLNRQALETALVVALMLKADPVHEIHIMRKTVIDGSNTTGFQRTCVVAFDGKVDVHRKTVPIQHVGLEEDAARKIGEDKNTLIYRIDRLCIPLVEVATAPVIQTPKEAGEVALAIGRLLRATGMVRRGLGTVRQDLNISIAKGALVEIKGVQELDLVSLVVEYEVQRQQNLLKIKTELLKRRVKGVGFRFECVDVTNVFADTKCKVIDNALKKGKVALAVRLPGFEGLLQRELAPGLRLGTEMADRARFWGRVGGIFHTDELPAYGITNEEVDKLKRAVKTNRGDAVVFVVDSPDAASDALQAVQDRATEALDIVPQETRTARPDGTTRYMRPRPGAARMYPETDVPAIPIPRAYIDSMREHLPELPDHKMQRLIKSYGLNKKLAKQVLDSRLSMLFEQAVKESKASPTMIAVTLTETLKALKREGVEIENVSRRQFLELFHLLSLDKVAKEAVSDIITWLSKREKARVIDAIHALDLEMLSTNELENIVDQVIRQNRQLLTEHGEKAFGTLLGLTMKNVRGRARPDVVIEIIKRRLKSVK